MIEGSSPMKKKKNMGRKLVKILKQQEHFEDEKDYLPGKIDITSSSLCKPRIVNFFGDIHTEVFCLNISYDDQYVATGCSNGDIKVYNIFQGKLLTMGNTSRLSGFPNTAIRWNPKSNRQFLACNCDGTIKWYDRESEVILGHYESQVGYLCADYNCTGEWSAFGNEKHEIEIFDSETKKIIQKYESGNLQLLDPNHMNRIFSLKGIKTDPNLFFTGGWDSTVRLWDVRLKDTYVRKFSGPSVSADSLDLRGDVLLVGNYSNNDIVQLWDFKSGQLIKNIDIEEKQPGKSYCFAATYAEKSKYNLIGVALSGVNKVKVLRDESVVAELKMQAAPLSIEFYTFNNKDFMLVGGIQGTIYVIKLKMSDLQK